MPATRKKAAKKRSARKACLTPKCINKAESRGLCANCFQAAHRLMKSRNVKDEDLVAANLILPSRRGGNGALWSTEAMKRLGLNED